MNVQSMMRVAALAIVATAGATVAQAADITGAGSTFVYPALAKWADAYNKETGDKLNYQSIGSGGGIKQITNKTVAFGASDMPLKPEQLKKLGLVQFPIVNGAVVPVVNLPGIKPGEIVLDGPTLAGIYMGTIKTWDDAAIKKLNPKVKLPSTAIVVVHRSDGSGTTFIWTNYLSKVSADWKSKIGESTAVEWPVGIGAKGNEGVANNVGNTAGSIGYVEYAYAKQNKMTYADMMNSAGKTVAPTAKAFEAAAASAEWSKAEDYYVILTNAPGAEAWPVAGSTFGLVYAKPADAAQAAATLKFFAWGYNKGKALAADLDYVPMPENVVKMIEATWSKQIKDSSGKPVFGGASN